MYFNIFTLSRVDEYFQTIFKLIEYVFFHRQQKIQLYNYFFDGCLFLKNVIQFALDKTVLK